MLENTTNALVIGASGAMGQALVENFLEDSRINRVIAISRSASEMQHPKLQWICTEYEENTMFSVVDNLKEFKGSFSKVCICHGILHERICFQRSAWRILAWI